MHHAVGAFEAKTHFSALLARVELGETILITRRGKMVARFLPIEEPENNQKALNAVQKLRALRQKVKKVSATDWLRFRDEGRQ